MVGGVAFCGTALGVNMSLLLHFFLPRAGTALCAVSRRGRNEAALGMPRSLVSMPDPLSACLLLPLIQHPTDACWDAEDNDSST